MSYHPSRGKHRDREHQRSKEALYNSAKGHEGRCRPFSGLVVIYVKYRSSWLPRLRADENNVEERYGKQRNTNIEEIIDIRWVRRLWKD